MTRRMPLSSSRATLTWDPSGRLRSLASLFRHRPADAACFRLTPAPTKGAHGSQRLELAAAHRTADLPAGAVTYTRYSIITCFFVFTPHSLAACLINTDMTPSTSESPRRLSRPGLQKARRGAARIRGRIRRGGPSRSAECRGTIRVGRRACHGPCGAKEPTD